MFQWSKHIDMGLKVKLELSRLQVRKKTTVSYFMTERPEHIAGESAAKQPSFIFLSSSSQLHFSVNPGGLLFF